MHRRTPLAVALLAVLAAAGLWWTLRDTAEDPRDVTAGSEGADTRERAAPELKGQLGRALESPGPPAGTAAAGPASPEHPEDPIWDDQTRVEGTVRLRGRDAPLETGEVHLDLIEPAKWPGSWEVFDALTWDERSLLFIRTTAQIKEDGTYRVDVKRGARIFLTRIRPRRHWEPGQRLANFVGTNIPQRVHAAGERLRLDLRADPGLQLAGRVVDAQTGAPVVGARVIRARLGEFRAWGVSGADGRFTISGLFAQDLLPHRPIEFRAEHADYVPQVAVARYDESSEAYRSLDVQLRRGVRVAGIVRKGGHRPRDKVRLLLIEAQSSERSIGIAERILAEADTDADGRFEFLPIEPIEDATLRVPPAGGAHFGGGTGIALRGLDLRKDRTDLAVELGRILGVAILPHFPDGTPATVAQSRAIVRDVTGSWRVVPWSGSHPDDPRGAKGTPIWWAPMEPGHAHHVVAYAERKEKDGTMQRYRGEAAARVQDGDSALRGVWVDLVPYDAPVVPPAPTGVHSVTLDRATFARHVWQLRIQDAVSGKPLGSHGIEVTTGGGTLVSMTLKDEGLMRLAVGLGLSRVRLQVEGYEPFEACFEPRQPGYGEAVISLKPREDR